jgi:hypothetical protein
MLAFRIPAVLWVKNDHWRMRERHLQQKEGGNRFILELWTE